MEKIRVSMTSSDRIEIGGLNQEEVQTLQSMVLGGHWCIVTPDGRLQSQSRWEPLPAPAQDETMMPFWQPMIPGSAQTELQGIEMPLGAQASLVIEHVCGYHYTPENYRSEVEKLKGFGFECLRSRRGPDARFWEIWRLAGLWSAQGQLKDALAGINNPKEQVDEAIRFLCRNASFGSLDVCWQRAAMQADD